MQCFCRHSAMPEFDASSLATPEPAYVSHAAQFALRQFLLDFNAKIA